MSKSISAIDNLPLGATLDIFTDGSCIGNPGPAGCGFAVIHEGELIHTSSASLGLGTNNIAELSAAIEATRLLQSRPDLFATITSDSGYVIKGMTIWLSDWKKRNWKTADKKPVKNRELWLLLDDLSSRLPLLKWKWVKGHTGNVFNNMADGLAKKAALSL